MFIYKFAFKLYIINQFSIITMTTNKKLNFCEILKGHEGESFYSPIYGDLYFIEIFKIQNEYKIKTSYCYFNKHGQFAPNGELMLFPSKYQRDWNKWLEEQKSKVPKTWNKLSNKDASRITGIISVVEHEVDNILTTIEKSVFALLKINKLIKISYGGNVDKTKEFWAISYNVQNRKFIICRYKNIIYDNFITAFNTEEQAKDFLSHPENIQLLKEYFMI